MDTISLTRIRQLWIGHTLCRRKFLLTTCLGVLFALYAIRLVGFSNNAGLGDYSFMYYLAFCVYMAAFMASAFSVMKTKEKRIGFLSLPATTAEKFIAYGSWHVIVPVILFVIALIGSEIPGALTVHLLGNTPPKATETILTPLLIKSSITFIGREPQASLFITTISVFTTSLFFLGSCVWYKNVFLKTVAAIGTGMFLLLLYQIVLTNILESCDASYEIRSRLLFYPNMDGWRPWMWIVSFGIGTILVWWISYRLFARREAVSQKRDWKCFLKRNK